MREAYLGDCLPIAVNGLGGGAESAFACEAVRDAIGISGSPVLILVENESERQRVTEQLKMSGINAVGYKKRDLVFHNIRASHDLDRERLSVLAKVLSGSVDAVVSTPSAAVGFTLPSEMLKKLSLNISVGNILPPESLSEGLVAMGFARVDAVESRGQFSRRGGIIDYFGGESESPVRVEFFGDEVDRISYFDPISQRTTSPCEGVELLPAAEVMVDSAARARMLASCNRLLDEVNEENARQRLMRERAVLQSDLTVDFRDKYLPLIYENQQCLLDYLGQNGRYICLTLGTTNCNEELKKYTEYLKNENETLQKEGLIEKKYSKFHLSSDEYAHRLATNLTVHVNSFAGGVGSMTLSGLFGFRTRRCVNYGGNFSMLLEDLQGLRRSGYRILLLTENQTGTSSLIASLAEAGFGKDKCGLALGVQTRASKDGSLTVLLVLAECTLADLLNNGETNVEERCTVSKGVCTDLNSDLHICSSERGTLKECLIGNDLYLGKINSFKCGVISKAAFTESHSTVGGHNDLLKCGTSLECAHTEAAVLAYGHSLEL